MNMGFTPDCWWFTSGLNPREPLTPAPRYAELFISFTILFQNKLNQFKNDRISVPSLTEDLARFTRF